MTLRERKIPGRKAAEIAGLTLCLGLAGAALLRTYACLGLSPALARQLTDYVIARRHLPVQTQLHLVGSQLMPGSCMRQVTFADPAGARYSIVISPDQKYAFGGSRFSNSMPFGAVTPPQQMHCHAHSLTR